MRSGSALFLAAAGTIAIAGCGSGDGGSGERAGAGADGEPALPFPPRAEEPATSRGGGPAPAGTVIKLGGRPEGAAVDAASGTLGVALDDRANGFALLDAATLRVRETVPLPGGARHVAVAQGRFLVPIEDADQLALVPAGGGSPELVEVGDGPHDAAVVGDDVLVGDEFGGTVTAVRDGRARRTVEVDVQPGGVADVGGGKAAVISVRANTIGLLDAQTLRRGGSQNAGYGPSHVVASLGDGRAFVADTRGGAILEYATRPRLKALSRLEVGGSPYGLAIDEGRQRLWVTDTGADRLLEIGIAARPRIVRTYPTVRQPNTVAVDTRTGAVFVIGQALGQLQRIRAA